MVGVSRVHVGRLAFVNPPNELAHALDVHHALHVVACVVGSNTDRLRDVVHVDRRNGERIRDCVQRRR